MSRDYCCYINNHNIKSNLMDEREETIEDANDELERLSLRQRELEGQQKELNRALKLNFIRIGQATLRLIQERN